MYSYLYSNHVILCVCICHSIGFFLLSKSKFFCVCECFATYVIVYYGLRSQFTMTVFHSIPSAIGKQLKKKKKMFICMVWMWGHCPLHSFPMKLIGNEQLLEILKCWYDMKWAELAKNTNNTYPQNNIKMFWMTWRQHLLTLNL